MFEGIPGEYLEPTDVEKALGLGDGAIAQLICKGRMPWPYVKIRTRTRIRKDALIDWLMSNERQPDGSTLAPASVEPIQQTSLSAAPEKRRRGRPPKVRDLAREAAYVQE